MSYYPGAVPALLEPLPAGAGVTPGTLKRMVAIARKYKSDTGVIALARNLIQNVPSTLGRIEKLQAWVRDYIAYVPDPRGLEMVQTPPATLRLMAGDCDDKSVLLATLLETIGLATQFAAVGMNGEAFSHVLPEVRFGRGWLAAETIVPGAGVGWFPPDATSVYRLHV